MAALIRHGSFTNAFKSTLNILAPNTVNNTGRSNTRYKSKRTPVKKKGTFIAAEKSLADRGFLRPQKSYQVPNNVCEEIDKICEDHTISAHNDTKLEDPVVRFNIFVACENVFKHSIPNSLLYTIQHIGDLKLFYSTSVDAATPYETLCKAELPENLHVQAEYHRFHPDTDVMFGGKTAFPKSSTIVTGLKYKKKYPGHMQENPWLSEQLKI